MIIANIVGIKVFVTGGIGGVHIEGEKTFDISADLIELGKTPVAVICAGVKSILDIPKTLEFLETQGVATISFRQESSFNTKESGFKASCLVDDERQCAEIIDTQFNVL